MIGQELIIKFYKDKAYLTESTSLSLNQVGDLDRNRQFKAPAYWCIKVLNHNVLEKKLFCDITSFEVGEINFSLKQQLLFETLSNIQKITFRDINTIGLVKTREGKTKLSYKPGRDSAVKNVESPSFNRPMSHSSQEYDPLASSEIILKENFKVPIKNIQFCNGRVSFSRKFKGYHKKIELNIYNSALIEEYDAIKNYFSKVLNTKNIEVEAEVSITDGFVSSKKAESSEINKIDQAYIENVKLAFLDSKLKKNPDSDIDKTLLSLDDLLEILGENNFDTKIFYDNTDDLFQDILSVTKPKHYHHLRFLSSKQATQIMKLRFVHRPLAFVFLIEGSHYYYVVWETFNTKEATYVWTIDKDLKTLRNSLRYIENIISNIKDTGKTTYINDAEDKFDRIYHNYSDQINGFRKWKGELEALLK